MAMADNHQTPAGDHKKGSMDISEQERTWNAFMGLTKLGTFATVAIVAFLTMWLVLGWNFLPAMLIVGLLVAILMFVMG